MGMLTVQVWDATGNKRQDVELPDDAPVNRILAVLLERMKFPQYAPDGQPLSYKFHHRATGKQLLDTQTLADLGTKTGDVLRLQPEITAGIRVPGGKRPTRTKRCQAGDGVAGPFPVTVPARSTGDGPAMAPPALPCNFSTTDKPLAATSAPV